MSRTSQPARSAKDEPTRDCHHNSTDSQIAAPKARDYVRAGNASTTAGGFSQV
jgi:hypothetical protein